jgi:hypothetical protein
VPTWIAIGAVIWFGIDGSVPAEIARRAAQGLFGAAS